MFNKLKKTKRGVAGINFLTGAIGGLFGVALLVMVIALIGSNLVSTITDTTAIDAINDSYVAITEIVDWFSTFIVIIAAAVVMGFVAVLFFFLRKSGMLGDGGA